MELKPIHKFNNGNGATLCNCCRTIISVGDPVDELFCEDCKPNEALKNAAKKYKTEIK